MKRTSMLLSMTFTHKRPLATLGSSSSLSWDIVKANLLSAIDYFCQMHDCHFNKLKLSPYLFSAKSL